MSAAGTILPPAEETPVTSQRTRPPFLSTRLGRISAFAGIVWAVAGSFIALELAARRGLDVLLARPDLAPSFALSRVTRESRTCAVQAGERAAVPVQAPSPAAVQFNSWLMGLKVGRDALARQYGSVDRGVLAEARREIRTIARGLGVPPPAVFTPHRSAQANTEFIAFVEDDPSGTARHLTGHSPRTCHLFKLGALWGYASLVRPALPGERPIFAAEIRHHALEAGLPPPLWTPMIERTPRGAPASQIAEASMALTQRVTDALQRAP
jgi:hypothetical protein